MRLDSIFKSLRGISSVTLGAMAVLASGAAFADSISPTSFSANLGIGESVTISKTVTITKAPPTSALIDVMFLFDTTGSMGGAIAGAKTMATGLLSSLGSLGNIASGNAFYNDPGAGVLSTINTNPLVTQASINTLGASGGGDFPELGYAGITAAATSGGWRTGSNRFIVALGDAGFYPTSDIGSTTAAMTSVGAKLIGIDFTSFAGTPTFSTSINGLGGTTYASSSTPSTIASTITAGIIGGFQTYSTVTVDDLGGGMPAIDVSTVCTGPDIGACAGADATGAFDRSVDRTFTFDVTFKRTGAGDMSFDTFALADSSILARESDHFPVPEPASLALVAAGLLGLRATRRHQSL